MGKRQELAKTELIAELPLACSNEQAAVEFLERKRWGSCPACPSCGSVAVYQMLDKSGERSKRFLWRCRDCSKQYSVRTGTVYAESLIPLHKWLRALWESASSKNGVSALEISRKLQISYKSALFLMHRIRHAMTDTPGTTPKLSGTVEADETYVGGRPRHSQRWEDGSVKRGPNTAKPKTPVFAVVERGGKVRARVLATVTSENVTRELLENVDRSAKLMTDESNVYKFVGKPFASHDCVKHSAREYVNKKNPTIHSNTIEGFFSRVKRKLNGTHHAVSKKHLHRYLSEAAFIYNTRELNDGERVLKVIKDAEGKRLMYREPA